MSKHFELPRNHLGDPTIMYTRPIIALAMFSRFKLPRNHFGDPTIIYTRPIIDDAQKVSRYLNRRPLLMVFQNIPSSSIDRQF
jgi:hypothetical protein